MSKGVWKDLRRFKSAYHRARDPATKLIGDFKFQLNQQGRSLQVSRLGPDESEALRLAILLAEFASPDGDLFFEELVTTFKESVIIKPELDEELSRAVRLTRKSPIPYSVDGEPIDGPEIFSLFGGGNLFRADLSRENTLKKVTGGQELGCEFMRYLFLCYCVQVWEFLVWFYGIVREKELEGSCSAPEPNQIQVPKCLYCLTEEGEFTSVEHIYPESLGNTEFVLPRGSVCNNCNNTVLAGRDHYLLRHELVAVPRVLTMDVNPKTGKYTKAATPGFRLERMGPRLVRVHDMGMSRSDKIAFDQGELRWRSQPFDPLELGRSLFKIGLGMIALEKGHIAALHPRYDAARRFVMGEDGFTNYLYMLFPSDGFVHEISDTLIVGEVGSIMEMSLFGVKVVFNLEHYPLSPHPMFFESASGRAYWLKRDRR